jgi:uncharacterized protein
MSREFPDFLNPWKAADGQRTFQGTMPLSRMRRLAPLLVPAGHRGVGWKDAGFRADFAHDRQGMVTVEVWVEAELPLLCQRSLQPYVEQVQRHSLLAVIETVAEQEELPEHYEPVLVEHGRMALLDLVEDELLLAVPQVPRNPEIGEVALSTDGPGAAATDEGGAETRRPFEGLAGLLRKRADD